MRSISRYYYALIFNFRYDFNEALLFLADSGTSFSSVDLYITPPASTLSDGDSDDEDQPESINHLSGQNLFFILALIKFQGINRPKMTQLLSATIQGQLKHTHQLKKRIALQKKADPKENGYLLIYLKNISQLTKHQSTTLKIGCQLKCLNCFSTMNYLN